MVEKEPFVTKYRFHKDDTKAARTLESVRVGGVYITRIIVHPKCVVGNVYLAETNIVFFVQIGELDVKFVQPESGEEKTFPLGPDSGIIHMPPKVGFAIKNNTNDDCVMVCFSDKPLHDREDDVAFEVMPI